MAEDQDLKIKLLRIQSKLNRKNRRECFRELFQWLTERRFKAQWPQSEEECVRVLTEEVSQQVYDTALSKGWIWQEQTRTYTAYLEYFHGPGVREINERNRREAHRLPTAAEFRDAWWADLILEWQARFLESRKTKEAPLRESATGASSAIPAEPGIEGPDPERFIQGKKDVTVAIAARYLGRSVDHVRRLVRMQKLSRVGQGRPMKVSTESLRTYRGT